MKQSPSPIGRVQTSARGWTPDSPLARIVARATIAEIDEASAKVSKNILAAAGRLKLADKPTLTARRRQALAHEERRLARLMQAKSIILGKRNF